MYKCPTLETQQAGSNLEARGGPLLKKACSVWLTGVSISSCTNVAKTANQVRGGRKIERRKGK